MCHVCGIRTKKGTVSVRENGRTEVWKRHMKKVMNEEHKWDRKVKADVLYGPMERVTMGKMQEAIEQVKSGKRPEIRMQLLSH
jgi:hypothetical protein